MDSLMLNNKLIKSLAAVLWVLAMSVSSAQTATPPLTQTGSCPALLNHTFPRLQDEKPQSLCQYSGKVILVVNTASYCGFTSQYKGLEAVSMTSHRKKATTKTSLIFVKAPLA